MTHTGEALLDGRHAHFATELVNPSCNVERLHTRDHSDAARLTPSEKFASRARISATCVRIANRDGEELEETTLGLAVSRRDQDRQRYSRGERRQFVHCRGLALKSL